MCREKSHVCKFCKREYPCNEPQFVCPTVNFDEDALMCPSCKELYVAARLKILEDERK